MCPVSVLSRLAQRGCCIHLTQVQVLLNFFAFSSSGGRGSRAMNTHVVKSNLSLSSFSHLRWCFFPDFLFLVSPKVTEFFDCNRSLHSPPCDRLPRHHQQETALKKRGGLPWPEQQGRRKHCREESRVHGGLGRYHGITLPLMFRIVLRLWLLGGQRWTHLLGLGLFVWKTAGLWRDCSNLQNLIKWICSCYHAPIIFVVWSNLLKNGGQRWGKSALPTLSVVGVFC